MGLSLLHRLIIGLPLVLIAAQFARPWIGCEGLSGSINNHKPIFTANMLNHISALRIFESGSVRNVANLIRKVLVVG